MTVILNYGLFMGWLSPALPLLISENTPLHTGPMTNDDLSWIGGAVSIGAVIGTFLFGFLSVKYGSKSAMACCAFPCIAFWIIIYFGDTFYYVFFSRLIGGKFRYLVLFYKLEKKIFGALIPFQLANF